MAGGMWQTLIMLSKIIEQTFIILNNLKNFLLRERRNNQIITTTHTQQTQLDSWIEFMKLFTPQHELQT